MRVRLREESGFALVGALMLALIMLGFGVALASSVDTQTSGSRQERTRESSFNVAEAALNAHALQLSRNWATSAVPACNPSAADTKCPEASAVSGGYSSADFAGSCPTSPSTPVWQTVVRDNGASEKYWTTTVNSRAAYDLNADNIVWVRSTGFVQCKEVSIVALVSRSVQAMDFPNNVLTANWFETSNQGRKVIVDTLGVYAQGVQKPGAASQPAGIKVRCSGLSDALCKNYQTTKGQIQPPTVGTDTGSTSALSLSQLQALERQAKAANTYYSAGSTCSPTAGQLSSVGGAPVVIEGPCTGGTPAGDVEITTGTINSSASPGVLVIKNGTLTLGGNAFFYGLIYMLNQQGATHPTPVMTIQGNATVQGSVAADGNGGIRLGSSKTNLIYDPRAPTLLRGDAGANINKNTFRVLPRGTPQ